MHELGIATSILRAARQEAQRHPGSRLRKIKVRVGEWSGVDPQALSFAFEVLARGQAAPLQLQIETCPRKQRCSACGQTFAVAGYDLSCPACGNKDTQFAGGDELELASLEMEDDEPGSIRAQGS